MKLSLGPVLFYWDKAQLGNFYAEMSALPLDVIYLGKPSARNAGPSRWINGWAWGVSCRRAARRRSCCRA